MKDVTVSRFLVIGAIALALLAGGFGSWSVLTQINGAVVARGQLTLSSKHQVVQHPSGGLVAAVLIAEGDHVMQGDVLVRLDAADLQSDLAVVEAQYFALLTRRARLEAEADNMTTLRFDPQLPDEGRADVAALVAGQQQLFTARLEASQRMADQLVQQRAQIASQMTGIAAQQAAVATQRRLAARELDDQQNLLRSGLTQTSRVLALEREDAVLLGRSGELTALAAQAAERMAEIDLQLQSQILTRQELALGELRDLSIIETELAQRRQTLIRDIDRAAIRATTAGVIHDLRVSAPKSVIRPAEPILFVVPQDGPLVVAAQIDNGDIGQLSIGQEVTLRFAKGAHQGMADQTGSITHISADTFRDTTTGLHHYRVEIALQRDGDTARPLLPGMPVDVFIRTAARRPLDYLLDPFTRYFTRSFRDG